MKSLNLRRLTLIGSSGLNDLGLVESILKRLTSRLISFASAVLLAMGLVWASMGSSFAAIDVYEFDTPQQEAQYRGLIEEFRCPKCQNQNLAGSDAPIAQDLKQKTYEMVQDGRSDTEIRNYMAERYGDFISYKPPVRPSTWILWFFPPLLLILVLIGWFWRTKRQAKVASVGAAASTESTYPSAQLSEQEQAELDALLSTRNEPAAQNDNQVSSHDSGDIQGLDVEKSHDVKNSGGKQ